VEHLLHRLYGIDAPAFRIYLSEVGISKTNTHRQTGRQTNR